MHALHPTRTAILVHAVILGLLCGSLLADDDLDDMLSTAKPAPPPTTTPASQPSANIPDALGTLHPKPPAYARTGTITLNDNTKIQAHIFTPLNTPLRVWIDETKSYTDLDLALLDRIDVLVLSEKMEDDWRWLKEGSDQKIYSGKKYPNLELAYKFTLLNHQTLEGPIVAEIDALTSKNKNNLALYKKYKGKLDETLKDLTYIKSIQLNPPNPNTPTPTPTPTSKKLPLIY
jgi:hypothetical protein